jgi:hypothetical protein
VFTEVDESIRQLLVQRGNLDSGEIDISFDMPTRDWAAGISKPTVNVYLYDVRENVELKNPYPWQVRQGENNTAIKSRPDVRVDLTYRITAFANAIEDEHHLLTGVLVTLLRYPLLPQEVLQGSLAGQDIPTVTARPDRLMQTAVDYWGALDNDIKPSIDYVVTTRIELSQEITVGLALTSQFRLGQVDHRNGAADFREMPLAIGGRIHRSGDAESGIPGVMVTLLERALDTVTDEEGRYRFSGVLPGAYTLVITAPDADEFRQQIEVPGSSYDVGL